MSVFSAWSWLQSHKTCGLGPCTRQSKTLDWHPPEPLARETGPALPWPQPEWECQRSAPKLSSGTWPRPTPAPGRLAIADPAPAVVAVSGFRRSPPTGLSTPPRILILGRKHLRAIENRCPEYPGPARACTDCPTGARDRQRTCWHPLRLVPRNILARPLQGFCPGEKHHPEWQGARAESLLPLLTGVPA